MKKSFVLYTDKCAFINDPTMAVSDEEAGRIFKAIIAYHQGIEIPQDRGTKMIMKTSFIPDFERDAAKYEEIRKKRSEAGKNHRGNQYSNGTSVPNSEQVGTKWNKLEQNGTNGTSVPICSNNGTSVPNSEQVFQSNTPAVPSENWNKCSNNGTSVPKMEQNGTNGTGNVNVNGIVNDNGSCCCSNTREEISTTTTTTTTTAEADPFWVISKWNGLANELHLPRVFNTPQIKDTICATLRFVHENLAAEFPTPEVAVEAAFKKIRNSAYCKRTNASADWVFKQENFVKILQGNYDQDFTQRPQSRAFVEVQEHTTARNFQF